MNPPVTNVMEKFHEEKVKKEPDFETVICLTKEKRFPYWEKYKKKQICITIFL